MIDVQREIEALVEFDGRWAGTDAERRAAQHLKGRLEELGREAEVEPIHVYPNYALTHAIHAALAVVGSVLSVSVPVAGVVLVLIAAVSAFGDLTGSFHLVRRLTGRRASQNVLSREDGDKEGTLVLVAHYDAARTGLVFSRRAVERGAVISKLVRRPIGPFEPYFWSIMAVLVCASLRLVGIEGLAVTIVQFIPTVVLIVATPLFVDIALSRVVPGANDNASGVATVLWLAERYGGKLENHDVWVLFTGAEEGLLLGMRAFLKQHAGELDADTTKFLNIDTVGSGTVRWVTKEGFVLRSSFDRSLTELCEEIGEGRAMVNAIASDGHAARTAGLRAISLSCRNALDYSPHYHSPTDVPENIEPAALKRAGDFSSALIELIDERALAPE
jgi:Peptidase family M28